MLFQSCIACEYLKEFSNCNEDSMIALVTPINCSNQEEYVVSDLPCAFSCPAGSYLDLEISNNTLKCSLCSQGTYNIGGGIQLNSQTTKNVFFKSYCRAMDESGRDINQECIP